LLTATCLCALQTAADCARTSVQEVTRMNKFNHTFVGTYDGLVGFGADRQTDENTLKVYFQMISDDETLDTLVKRMDETALEQAFSYISGLLKQYLSEDEYHEIFLKDSH
jgi:hypothetical protein